MLRLPTAPISNVPVSAISPDTGPIALFDSGVGGLSVLRHLRTQLPNEDLIYFADQAHVPYGPRPASEIIAFCHTITRFFLDHKAKMVVVACNTATAAALNELRASFPDLPFVGMEPAVKPGAEATRSGKVGVLATAGTFESQRYARLMARFARNVTLYENPCSGLVPLIEAGELHSDRTRVLLQRCITPMLQEGVDTLVLGCTHYPFVQPLIQEITGPHVRIIDPAPAVVRQARRVLAANDLHTPATAGGAIRTYTSGDPQALAQMSEQLLGQALLVQGVQWVDFKLFPLD
jgi:glutamate racemase